MECFNKSRDNTTNTTNPHFRLINNSEYDISMDKLMIIDYCTPESETAQNEQKNDLFFSDSSNWQQNPNINLTLND